MSGKNLVFLWMLCLLLPLGAARAEAIPGGGAAKVTRTGATYASLEEAVAAAQDGDTIELLQDARLTVGNLAITKSVSILSQGNHVVSRAFGGNAPMVRIGGGGALTLGASGGTLTLDGKNYAGSRNSVVRVEAGGALRLCPGASLTGGKATYGGGVYVQSGAVEMTGGEISGNTARSGGGIYIESGTVAISGGEILGNNATFDGGGIDNEAGGVQLSGGAVTGNKAGRFGGGACNRMQLSLSGGAITGNTGASGGGVYNNASFRMTGGEISKNASQTGGGMWNAEDGTFTLDTGMIRNNTSTGDGGGACNQGAFTMNGGQIAGNAASGAGGGVNNQGVLKLAGGSIEDNRARSGGGVQQAGDLALTGCRFTGNSAELGGGIYAARNSGSTLLDDPNPFADSTLYFEKAPVINQKVNLSFSDSAPGTVAVQRGEWVSGDWFQLTGMPGCELKRVPCEGSYALRVFQATTTSVALEDPVYGEAPVPVAVVRAGSAEVANPQVHFGYAAQPEGPFTDAAPEDAGTYWVQARYEGGGDAFLNESTGIASFEILPAAPTIALSDGQALYTGRPVSIGPATVTGIRGAPLEGSVTYDYYSDPACTIRLPGPPTEPGETYVTATAAARKNYTSGTSAPAKLTIGRLTGLQLAAPDGAKEGGGYGMLVSETLQLEPKPEPAWADCPVLYASSDRKVATVDENGLVTAVGEGRAILTATARDAAGAGSFASSVTLAVHGGVASVSLPAEAQVFPNARKRLSATVSPANAPDKALTWSIEPKSAGAIGPDGTVTAGGAPAKATVSAISGNGRKGSCTLYITVPAESVEVLAPGGNAKLPVDATLQLTAWVLPAQAYQRVSWKSSNRWVAPVDDNGLVRGRKPGKVILTATAKDGTKVLGTYALEVVIPVETVSLPESASVPVGGSVRLTAALAPKKPTDETIQWFSGSPCATVSQDGVVTGVSKGVAAITATAEGGASATCNVTVVPQVASIKLSPVSGYWVVYAGETVKLNVEILPEDAGDKALTWRSTMVRIARASGGGEVRALRPGKAAIIAEAADGGGASGRIDLTVVQPAPSIKLNQQNAVLYTNGEPGALQLTATVPGGTEYRALTWSVVSGASISVDGQGAVKALSDGEAMVRATTDRGVYAECHVSVRTLPSHVRFEKPAVKLKPGESLDLKQTLSMDGSEPALSWMSADPSVVRVTPEGVVTAGKKAGSAAVTAATLNGLTASCTVTIQGEGP